MNRTTKQKAVLVAGCIDCETREDTFSACAI